MATREQEFSDVRALLDFPKEQRPSPHLLISNLIRQEQLMMNMQNGSGQGWSLDTVQLTSIADQEEYSLYSNDPTNTVALTGFGKSLGIYRGLDSGVIVPVPMTDFVNEFYNQSYDFMAIPGIAGDYPGFSGEKFAVYRNAAGLPKLRIYPSPTVARVYTIVYATGALDWDSFEWTDTPFLPEWSHFKCIATALFSLVQSEWSGLTFEQNRTKRNDLRASLEAQYKIQDAEFSPYLRNPQGEPSIGMIGAFYD